jgi:hypothetical protein
MPVCRPRWLKAEKPLVHFLDGVQPLLSWVEDALAKYTRSEDVNPVDDDTETRRWHTLDRHMNKPQQEISILNGGIDWLILSDHPSVEPPNNFALYPAIPSTKYYPSSWAKSKTA